MEKRKIGINAVEVEEIHINHLSYEICVCDDNVSHGDNCIFEGQAEITGNKETGRQTNQMTKL